MLALFGAPVAHEDDAERAVLCALGMQGAMVRWRNEVRDAMGHVEPAIRVGVNTGEVVSGSGSIAGRNDVDVTGDAVNTAARLQTAADPGEVLVGAETMRLTRRRIRYGEKRELILKGKTESGSGLSGPGIEEQFGERWEESDRATPLVGRDRELVDCSMPGAGPGRRRPAGHRWWEMPGWARAAWLPSSWPRSRPPPPSGSCEDRCLSYGQEISLWLLADLLRSLFGLREQDGLEEIGERSARSSALLGMLTQPRAGRKRWMCWERCWACLPGTPWSHMQDLRSGVRH